MLRRNFLKALAAMSVVRESPQLHEDVFVPRMVYYLGGSDIDRGQPLIQADDCPGHVCGTQNEPPGYKVVGYAMDDSVQGESRFGRFIPAYVFCWHSKDMDALNAGRFKNMKLADRALSELVKVHRAS